MFRRGTGIGASSFARFASSPPWARVAASRMSSRIPSNCSMTRNMSIGAPGTRARIAMIVPSETNVPARGPSSDTNVRSLMRTRLGVSLDPAQDAPRAIDDRRIQHLPVERDRALAARQCFVERAHDPPRLFDLRRGRAEDLVDEGDLIRMDERLAAEAEAARAERIGAKARGVLDVRPDAVERKLSRRHGGDDGRRARIQEVRRLALA